MTSFASAAGVGSAVMGAVAGGCGGLIEGSGGGGGVWMKVTI